MRSFEFFAYPEDAGHADLMVYSFEETTAAKAYAGRLAKRINGPVDLAHVGVEPWEERYIMTASPSTYHATGYRFERLT